MKNLETPGKTGRVGRYVYRYMLLQRVWFRCRFTCNSLSFCSGWTVLLTSVLSEK